MDKTIEVLKAVSDPTRLRILMAILEKEICVCKITEMLKLAPSTISKHMSILKHAGLIESRKDGKWIYYKFDTSKQNKNIDIVELIASKVINGKTIKQDKNKINSIISDMQKVFCKEGKCKN